MHPKEAKFFFKCLILCGLMASTAAMARGRSFYDFTAQQNRERVQIAAQASDHVYDAYDAFLEKEWDFRERKSAPGYFDVEGQSVEWEGIKHKIEGVFCAQKVLKHQECGLFVVLYRPEAISAQPVIAIKGTTSLFDWAHNITNRGAFFIAWIFELLSSQGNNDFRYSAELSATIRELKEFMGSRVILTGHSLGGGLAQALAIAISKELFHQEPPRIDLITFNSLAGESLLKQLGQHPGDFFKRSFKTAFGLQQGRHSKDYRFTSRGYLPRNVLSLSISTQDDLLQGVNKILRKENLGVQLILPSKRHIDHVGSFDCIRGGIDGHEMDVVLEDLAFTYDWVESLSFVEERHKFWSSSQGKRMSTDRARNYILDFRIDESDHMAMLTPARISAEHSGFASSYARMHDFLSNPHVIQILGLGY